MMLRYLMLTSFQIRYLLWESWVLWFKEKTPENRNSTGSKWKEAGFPANTNKFKALKSCLPHKNAPKCRFWALAIWNNVQIPQGRYWRRYLFYWWNRHERNASNIAKKKRYLPTKFCVAASGLEHPYSVFSWLGILQANKLPSFTRRYLLCFLFASSKPKVQVTWPWLKKILTV